MALQQFFYDKQIRRYIIQFIRLISNFQVEFGKDRNNITAYQRVPVIYGDSSNQAASVIKENSENYLNSVPVMAVYISGLDYDRQRLQSPTYVGKLNVRERYFDPATGDYSTTQGDILTVERLMPVPYKLTIKVDIWTSNTEQKLQILEQLCTLFNPALEIQSTDNYIDWTSITYILLTGTNWSSRSIPIGTGNPIDIATLTFELPIFISSPALVKKLGVIQKIIASVYDANGNLDESIYDSTNLLSRQYITPLEYGVTLLNNELTLVQYNNPVRDSFGTQVVKNITSNVSANNTVIVDDTLNVEPGMLVYGLPLIQIVM
jgi:T4-like virus Myoviridae tail sheath stabiliser